MRGKRFNVERNINSTLRIQFGGRIKKMRHSSRYFGVSTEKEFPISMSGNFQNWAFWFKLKTPAAYGKERFE